MSLSSSPLSENDIRSYNEKKLSKEIILTNPKIIDFFNNHEFEPETMIMFFVEILEKFGEDFYKNITSSINTQILNNVLELKQKNQLIIDNMNKINSDLVNSIFIKMIEIKKEYIDDTKMIVSSNTNEKISSILEKNNSTLIDKTNLLLNEILSKSNDKLYDELDENISHFQTAIKEDTSNIFKFMNEKNSDNIKEDIHKHLSLFEQRFHLMIHEIQKPIFAYINTSEERINHNIKNINETTTLNTKTQEKMNQEITEFLNKYRNSSYKGQFGENQLYMVLNQMFPTGEVLNTTSTKASGDFLLKRENKPTIMFENKDYDANVYIDEIRKFIRDVENQNTHGIFLSQSSGIASRNNYQIEFNNGKILVYVHNAEYSKEKIQIAVDIIDHLHIKIQEITADTSDKDTINKDVLDDINRDFQNFAVQKDNLINLLKETNKKSLYIIEELKLPSLDKYLSSKYASINNIKPRQTVNKYICEICNEFSCDTVKSMSAHKRKHRNENETTVS
jgi:hypothetical protein